MAKLKLRRLKIEKFRNVAPTELRFNDGFNILLGQNGTGKTTLLKLAAMVLSSNFSSLRHAEFSIEYDLSHPSFDLTVTLRNQTSKLEIDSTATAEMMPRIGSQRESMNWSYELEFRVKQTNTKLCMSATSDSLAIGRESSQKRYKQYGWDRNPFTPAFVFVALSAESRQAETDQQMKIQFSLYSLLSNNSVRLDEGLGGFAAMTGVAADSESEEIGNAQVFIHLIEGLPNTYTSNFVPALPVEKIATLADNSPSIISIKDTETDFLRKATSTMQFKRGELLLELQSKNVDDRLTELRYGRLGFRFTLDDGSIISQHALSYGQKRMLTFLYYSASNDNVVIADELVNGLHHEWIQVCLDEIGDRQALLTSQNPLLLDFLSFESADQVQRTFILCRSEKRGDKNTMVWSNLSDGDAERFHRAYEAGIQHVSDILRTKGLW